VPARDLLNELLGSAFDFLSERAAEVAPKCCYCNEVAIPIQCACGHYACKDHGFFNIEVRAICSCCAARMGAVPYERVNPPPRKRDPRRTPRGEEWRRAGQRARRVQKTRSNPAAAWELLELDPKTATAAEVKRACRQLAFECHPDLHPNDPTAAKRFRGLQAAKDACLEDLKRREGK
jgi:hypothetical protein